MKKRIALLLILGFSLTTCTLISRDNKIVKKKQTTVKNNEDLKRILSERQLKVVVDYNSTNYFVYKGQPLGFQYELLKAFAKELNVELKVFVSNNLEETFDGLHESQYDLIAKNLTVTKARSKVIDFTKPFALTRQVLIQRKPEGADTLSDRELDQMLIREQLDLSGKTVHVQKNTVFVQRLKNLSDEIGEPIDIVEDSVYGVEQLIALVAQGDIEYTVCDENVALVNQKYYPWIDISTPVSFNQKLSWGIRKNSPELKSYINNWIDKYKKTDEYSYLYYKYFSGYRSSRFVNSEFHSITGGKISEYDDLVREVSNSFNWDWRLVAAIIMQESNFDPYAESWVGAMGLMQLMPKTAEQYNIENITDPRENIRGGLEYLTWLENIFKPIVSDSTERLKFILASYNVGIGHVMDARKLAMKHGKSSVIWKDNVDYFILKKSEPKYYKDPVVKWGYCRGQEPYNYVLKILERYQHYVNVLPNDENVSLVSLPVLQESWR